MELNYPGFCENGGQSEGSGSKKRNILKREASLDSLRGKRKKKCLKNVKTLSKLKPECQRVSKK